MGFSSRDSPAALRSPKPQSAGRCAAEAHRGRPQPAAGERGHRRAAPRRQAAAPSPRAPAPRRAPARESGPARPPAAAAEPGGLGPGPQSGARGRSPRGQRARSGRGRGAPPLTLLGGVGLSFRSRAVRLGRGCPSRGPQRAVTGTSKSTWSPGSLKPTSSHRPLICIPEVAPRPPVRSPLGPPPPRSSPAARCRRPAGGTRRRRGRVWGWPAVSLLGKQRSPGCLQIFPERLSGLL